MTGRIPRAETGVPKESAIVVGTLAALRQAAPRWALTPNLKEDGYWLKSINEGGIQYTIVTAVNERGVLYGAFALLRENRAGRIPR